MKGMRNIAEHGKKPLGSQAKPVFFPVRKILTNFALAKDRQKTAFLAEANRRIKQFWK